MIKEFTHTGRRHKSANTDNQDYICSGSDRNNTVITLADGVSSCSESRTGARICGDTLTRFLMKKGDLLQAYGEPGIADMTLDEILYQLNQEAEKTGIPVEEYSSTFVSVLHDRKSSKLLCISLGDSMIIGVRGSDCYVLLNPYDSSDGCVVTTTSGAKSQTSVRILDDSELDSVILLSDGAWQHMFERGRLRREVSEILAEGDHERLEEFLTEQDGRDDYSFITMDINNKERRRREMERRQYLKRSITLNGESDGKFFERTFTIVRVINEGADGVCYEAYHGKSGRGVLKEFYPLGMPGFERTESGQLVYATEFPGKLGDFVEAKKEFVRPYEILLEMKRKDENQDLSTFIPNFELYYGPGSTGEFENTIYVWTPDPELETFSRICTEIHRHPDERPEYKLFTVLKAIETLTRCISALHHMDIIHRDIKPSNFGFKKRGNETLTQVISLFDIDKICSVWSNTDKSTGTRGYKEPESYSDYSTNQTDIYSIGATLFTALIVTEETAENGYLYTDEYYTRLAEMVRDSELIRASERNSDSRLRSILTTILKRTLCDRDRRYEDCEELLEDLGKALFYTLPPEVASRSSNGERWVLTAAEKKLDANKEKNSSLVMMYHLFRHPLYSSAGADEDELNVVIAGLGLYGPKFLDMCLPLGQMRRRDLSVHVIAEENEDIERYLEERPEIGRFFDISYAGTHREEHCEEPYGRIVFHTAENYTGHDEDLPEAFGRRIRRISRQCHIHYVFTDMRDGRQNREAANGFADILDEEGQTAHVCCVSEDKGRETRRARVYPVYVNSDVRKSELYREIERMAFNTHLVWEGAPGQDHSGIRKRFRKPYNHDSCVSNVVALKYRLMDAGIDLEKYNYEEAARRFSEFLTGSGAGQIRDELIWIEHRRWVTEKLCSGWSRLSEEGSIVAGSSHDEKAKKHICLVRSRPGRVLGSDHWRENGLRNWDEAPDEELAMLDELDRMSVELHRVYAARADVIRRRNLNSIGSLAEIRSLVHTAKQSKAPEIIGAFSEWYDCIASVWDSTSPGERSRVRRYKSLRDIFVKYADKLDEETAGTIRADVDVFDTFFYPVLAADEYREWKLNDEALIDSIPFVLTYTEKLMLIIPFAAGETADELFADVEEPVKTDPEKIIYLYRIGSSKDASALRRSLPRVTGFLRGRNLRASAEFIIIAAIESVSDEDIKDIVTSGGAKLRRIIRTSGSGDSWTEALRKDLRSAARGRKVSDLVRNGSKLSKQLETEGFYDEFTWKRADEEELCFMNTKPFITASDMFSLGGADLRMLERPEFTDEHEALWDRYCKDPAAWNILCNALRQLSDANDIIAEFPAEDLKARDKSEGRTYRYILPSYLSADAAGIIEGFKKCGLIGSKSRVTGFSSDACEVIASDFRSDPKQLGKIFASIHLLGGSDSPEVVSGDTVTVRCDNLMIRDADLTGLPEELIRYFSGIGYLILHEQEDGLTTLSYGSGQIKKLLNDPQRIAGLRMYQGARALGIFDDAAEIPGRYYICILTKGFDSYFAGYSADGDDERALEAVLEEAAQKYGINAGIIILTGSEPGKQLREKVR